MLMFVIFRTAQLHLVVIHIYSWMLESRMEFLFV